MALRNPIDVSEFGDFNSEHIEWHEEIAGAVNGTLAEPGKIVVGTGTPEGQIVAAIGTLYIDLVGGAGVTLFVKEANADDTGWVGK